MKFFLHSGRYPVSTIDVCRGYQDAMQRLGVPFGVFDWASFSTTLNDRVGLMISLGLAHRQDLGHTHLLNVGNPDMLEWWLASTPHLFKIAVTTDSPWDWSQYEKQMKYWDLMFVNDKSISDYYKSDNIIYLPTAYGHDCKRIVVDDPRYHSDVCFVGTVYPDRVPYLEAVYHYCVAKGYKFILRGGLRFVPESSILHKICQDGIVDHMDTIKYYSNAKIVINTNRNENWKPVENAIHNKLNLKAYSLNPRFYELAKCKTLQLMEATRDEINEYPGTCVLFQDTDSLIALIDRFLGNPGLRNEYIDTAHNIVKNHSYVERMKVILEKLDFHNNQLSQPIQLKEQI
jgi:spore maturation protein CgeB